MYNLFIWEIYENPMAFQNNKIIRGGHRLIFLI